MHVTYYKYQLVYSGEIHLKEHFVYKGLTFIHYELWYDL